MQRRRVGTLSMGIVLVCLGVTLIFSLIKGTVVTGLLTKGWPLVLLLLGGEVLWYTFSSKEESPKIGYDIFSIFIIGLICITSLGLYSLTRIGIIPRVEAMVSGQNYVLKTPMEEIGIDGTVNKVVIDASHCKVNIRTGTSSTVAVHGTAQVHAASLEEAQKLLTNQEVIYKELGDTLYISFNIPTYGRGPWDYIDIENYNIIVPQNIDVEVDNPAYLHILADQIKGNWQVVGPSTVEVNLPEDADIKLVALVDREEDLRGNVDWQIAPDDNAGEEASGKKLKGEITYGEGNYRIHIRSGGRVILNQV